MLCYPANMIYITGQLTRYLSITQDHVWKYIPLKTSLKTDSPILRIKMRHYYTYHMTEKNMQTFNSLLIFLSFVAWIISIPQKVITCCQCSSAQ